MDELFKKAAEHYPLNTDSADWDRVSQLLDTHKAKTIQKQKNKHYTKAYWLLLLLLIPAFICTKQYWLSTPAQNQGDHQQQKTADSPAHTTKRVLEEKNKTRNFTSEKITENLQSLKPKEKNSIHYPVNPTPNRRVERRKPSSIIPDVNWGTTDISGKSLTTIEDSTETVQLGTKGVKHNDNPVSGRDITTNTGLDTVKHTVSRRTQPASSSIQKRKPQASNNKLSKLYAGLIGGLDMSTIKLQSVNNVGYTLGALLGYNINKRLAVESGVYWSRKNYYSTGEYFNKDRTPLLQNTEVHYVEGSCLMWELPVNIRYNFKEKNNRQYYLMAGVTSYLMQKEYYDYNFTKPGQPTEMAHRSYKASTNDWFSALHLSGGIERAWGRKTKVRIEPYLRIPVSGMGLGSLPITSVGINLALTKKLIQ